MINIILCDDDKQYRSKMVVEVKKYMEKNNQEYSIREYCDYDSRFINIIKEELLNKIYILDIETPSRSGIDMARIIRKNDVESPIIFITGHEELGGVILTKDINFLSFINKFDNSFIRLKHALNTAIQLLNKKNVLKFNDRGSIYTLEFKNILYITTDTVARKTIIVTEKHEYKVNYTLNQLLEILTDDFVQTHKSCIVNKNRVCKINTNSNKILFDNGLEIDMLSSKYKREMVKC